MTVRVLQGDCLALLPAVADASVDMALCDLPYNGMTANQWDSAVPLPELWTHLRRVLVPGSAVVMFAAAPFDKVLYASNPQWFRYEWIWVKTTPSGFLNAEKAPLRRHETILVFCERQAPYTPQFQPGQPYGKAGAVGSSNYGKYEQWHTVNEGRRYPTTALEFPHEERGVYHPTQKPVKLLQYLLRTYTEPGAMVLDPTAGSGTTAVACIREGRSCIAIERDEAYYQTACRRVAEEQARPRLIPHEMAAQEAETQMSLESVV